MAVVVGLVKDRHVIFSTNGLWYVSMLVFAAFFVSLLVVARIGLLGTTYFTYLSC